MEMNYYKKYNYRMGVKFLKKNMLKTTMKVVEGVTQ